MDEEMAQWSEVKMNEIIGKQFPEGARDLFTFGFAPQPPKEPLTPEAMKLQEIPKFNPQDVLKFSLVVTKPMLEQLKNLGYSEAKIKTLTKVDISRILQFEERNSDEDPALNLKSKPSGPVIIGTKTEE